MVERVITGLSTALLTAAAALESYGTTPLAALLALFGAFFAMLEAETRHWTTRIMVLVFNSLVGILGGGLVALAVQMRIDVTAPGVLLLGSLLIGYVAHTALGGVKVAVASRVSRILRGRR
jgi:hypothetical protein